MTDTYLAALLLTNRIVDVGAKPLSASQFWKLVREVGDPGVLVGKPAAQLAADLSNTDLEPERIAVLLEAGTAFAFERERLEEEGVSLISALAEGFPARLQERLGDACPPFLLVAGPSSFLSHSGLGVVGSRDATPLSLEVTAEAARLAVLTGHSVVSGLARGVDQVAMSAALDAGGPVVGVPAEGLRVVARNPEIRRRVHSGELCIASPYAPSMRFTAGNAMGRNKIIYGLSNVTFVVCSDRGSGGTWEGAREALRRGFGRVAVWSGDGQGPGNQPLIELGGSAVRSLTTDLFAGADPAPATMQASLFD